MVRPGRQIASDPKVDGAHGKLIGHEPPKGSFVLVRCAKDTEVVYHVMTQSQSVRGTNLRQYGPGGEAAGAYTTCASTLGLGVAPRTSTPRLAEAGMPRRRQATREREHALLVSMGRLNAVEKQ